jgi:hypothetical protein
MRSPSVFLVLLASYLLPLTTASSKKVQAHHHTSIASQLWTQTRCFANLGSLFGSSRVTAQTPYERVGNHPVFQVTTSWGAPYMSFEKAEGAESSDGGNLLGFGGDMRPVTLFYMDPEDVSLLGHLFRSQAS